MQNSKLPSCVTTKLFLGGIALLEFVFLRKGFSAAFSSPQNLPFAPEAFFLMTAVIGAVLASKSSVWASKKWRVTAYAVFAAYVLWSVFKFSFFAQQFADCFASQYGQYYGMAMQAAKLFLMFIGLIAAIPASRMPTYDEYVHGLDAASRRQQMEWAAAADRGSQTDARRAMESLKAQLGEEEFANLYNQLKQNESEQAVSAAQNDNM